MRLLFVVQRYGREVAGGAELLCREFATRLAARGHEVDVLTSCATSYVDWADDYAPGTATLDGVTVHRLRVRAPRRDVLFGHLNSRVPWGTKPVPLYLQREWMRMQGPELTGLVPWIDERARSYDVASFFTYLYFSTWAGLPVASRHVPTVLHPTAHDEPAFFLELFDTTLRQPAGYGFLSPEEAELVFARIGTIRPHSILGVGLDPTGIGDGAAPFRAAHGLGSRPYLLFVGRLDPAKGSEELYEFFAAYKRRRKSPLALVIVGDPVRPLPPHPDIIVTGFVDEVMKAGAFAGSLALVQPSYFESFSMVLTEAWSFGKPVLVQGHCAVLAGQAARSAGGLPYRNFAEFEAAVDLLAAQPELAAELGRNGRRYVAENYTWTAVLERYEEFLTRMALAGRQDRVERVLN